MKRLTDEEYDALDEYYTKNPPEIDLQKNRLLNDNSPRTVIVDAFSGNWIFLKALETQKSSIEIIHEMIEKEIAAAQ